MHDQEGIRKRDCMEQEKTHLICNVLGSLCPFSDFWITL